MMTGRTRPGRRRWPLVGAILASMAWPPTVIGNPVGPSGLQGISDIQGLGTSQVIINQSAPKAILNWQQFNIAPGEVTRFVQPSAAALALNRIADVSPSRIFGSLQANGSVILLNPNGVLFGPNAQINVNGLIASSLHLSDANFLSGVYHFEGSTVAGAVRNAGTIETPAGGFVYLLAPNVENSGVIRTPEGHITLAAGTTAYLSNHPDGRGFLVEVTAPVGEALSLGDLAADAGRINLYGRVVNQAGFIRANSVREREGKIELFASDRLMLSAGSRTEARGGETGASPAGDVIALSDMTQGRTSFEEGAVIDVSGGVEGGDAGFIELSGAYVEHQGRLVGRAQPGYQGGHLLVDPHSYEVTQAVFEEEYAEWIAGGMAILEFVAEHQLDIKDVNVLLAQPPCVNGDCSLMPTSPRVLLRFSAGHDLRVSNTYLVNDPTGGEAGGGFGPIWDITLDAGFDVRLDDRSFIGTGYGGNLFVRAGQDVIAPQRFDGNQGLVTGLRLDPSFEDTSAGRLTLEAGRDFLGGFVLSDGEALVTAGRHVGSPTDYVNMVIGRGLIDIKAGQDIYVGRIEDRGLLEAVNHLSVADPDNAVDLLAGARSDSVRGDIYLKPVGEPTRVVYPASFQASAPYGSVFVEGHLRFWPSLTGRIDVHARDEIRGQAAQGTAIVELVPAAPADVQGRSAFEIGTLLAGIGERSPVGVHDAVPVNFRTDIGDIAKLEFRFNGVAKKQVSIEAGRDIRELSARIAVPRCLPECPQLIAAARDIDMSAGSQIEDSGFFFLGTGTAKIRAGGDLDLASSLGIQVAVGASTDLGGLLDIAVGGDLEMTRSSIETDNGASIAIHGLDGPETPVGGVVNVGTNQRPAGSEFGTTFGILTKRGGGIDIKATDNIEVNASRVATFGGGDIRMTSMQGDINAGSGGRNERVEVVVPERDAEGNVMTDQFGRPIFRIFLVPGSGIFSVHPDDPDPLPPFPSTVDSPELRRLYNPILALAFLGRDIPASLQEQYSALYAQLLKQRVAEFIEPLKLGNIHLQAEEDVVVPPAGIRGREIVIKARNLILEGGQVQGRVDIDVDSIVGDLGSIVGSLSGVVGGGIAPPPQSATASLSLGLSGTTGNLATSVSGSTVAEAVTEEVRESGATNSPEDEMRGGASGGEDEKKPVRSVRLKRGVTVEVQVSSDTPSVN